MFSKNNYRDEIQGFTLIELLVVIAIIALLSSVVVASLSTARMKARDAKRIADLGQIKLALEMHYDAKGYYPGIKHSTWNAFCLQNTYCWDTRGFMSTNEPDWQNFFGEDLKPYIAKLPIDPINTKSCYITDTTKPCYIYSYGDVGRDTYPHAYDLFTQLETPDHPQSCEFQKYRWGKGVGANDGVCAESDPPRFSVILNSNIYKISN